MKILKTQNITNGFLDARFSGKLLKIVFFTNEDIPNLRVTAKSNDGDLILDRQIEKSNVIVYPKMQVQVTEQQQMLEYFYIDEVITFEIKGLGTGQVITELKLYYE